MDGKLRRQTLHSNGRSEDGVIVEGASLQESLRDMPLPRLDLSRELGTLTSSMSPSQIFVLPISSSTSSSNSAPRLGGFDTNLCVLIPRW